MLIRAAEDQTLVTARTLPGGSFRLLGPPGGVVLSDQTVVLTRSTEDVVRGFSATCSHQGCLLASGSTESIDYSCHCSRFDPATGDVLDGAARSAIPPVCNTAQVDAIFTG